MCNLMEHSDRSYREKMNEQAKEPACAKQPVNSNGSLSSSDSKGVTV